jgi:alpha-beta hydrolase superfamily lysophospholipase
MGSFLVRQYLTVHGDGLDGAIIMGTGDHSLPELLGGRLVCRALALVKGWDYRSKQVKKLAMGSYNSHFQPETTSVEWLTKDEEIKKAYMADPLCNFDFTLNAYFHMFGGMLTLTRGSALRKIPVNLPILFISGRDDPVGNMGKGVIRVYNKYRKYHIQDVKIKLYKDDRHEILNELDRDIVYDDIYRWMEKRLGNRDLDIMRILASEEDDE